MFFIRGSRSAIERKQELFLKILKIVRVHIPIYVKLDRKCFEKDGLLPYIYQLKYQEYQKKQGKCLPNHNVVNFQMIHAPCRGLHLTKSAREYKTVKEEDFKSYPENEKLESISSCRRVSRTDLYFDFSLAK